MITDGGVTTRIVPGFLDALHHPSTTISCRVNCLRRLRRCVLDTSSPRWCVWWWALYGHRNRALQIARIVPSKSWTSSLKDADIAHNQSSSSSSLLGDLFQEEEVQNFESALRRVQDENVSLEARIECAKSIRYLPRSAEQARLIWDYATNDSKDGPSLRLRRALLDTIEISFEPEVVRELVSRECVQFMVAILFQLMVRLVDSRLPSKSLPSKSTPKQTNFNRYEQNPFEQDGRKIHFDFWTVLRSFASRFVWYIQTLQIKSLHHFSNPYCPKPFVQLKTNHVKCIEFRNSTICSTQRADNFLPLLQTSARKSKTRFLNSLCFLVNPMRAAAPRNKSLFQWKLHENKPIAYPRRRATGVMLAIIRMLLRRTLQRLGQGMSVSEDVTSLVTLMRGWDFKSNDKSDEKNEEEEDETKRVYVCYDGGCLLFWSAFIQRLQRQLI